MRLPRAVRPCVDQSAFAGFRFPPEVITVAVRWYLRYVLSYRGLTRFRSAGVIAAGPAFVQNLRRGAPPTASINAPAGT